MSNPTIAFTADVPVFVLENCFTYLPDLSQARNVSRIWNAACFEVDYDRCIQSEAVQLFTSSHETPHERNELSAIVTLIKKNILRYVFSNHLEKTEIRTISPNDLVKVVHFILDYEKSLLIFSRSIKILRKVPLPAYSMFKNRIASYRYLIECAGVIRRFIFNNQKKLSQIRKINLSYKNVTIFPREICSFNQLTTLDLSHNRLQRIPEDIGKIFQLVNLCLDCNELQTLPQTIVQCVNLEALGLNYNPISSIPALPSRLKFLGINGCFNVTADNIRSLPDGLMILSAKDCPRIPKSVLEEYRDRSRFLCFI